MVEEGAKGVAEGLVAIFTEVSLSTTPSLVADDGHTTTMRTAQNFTSVRSALLQYSTQFFWQDNFLVVAVLLFVLYIIQSL